jgi:hypothetical protein
VFKANYRGTTVALKSIKEVSQENINRFKDEIFLMHDLKHENIVLLIGACWEEDLMALVMEYCANGTAEDVLLGPEGESFTWTDPLLKWCCDVGRAVKYALRAQDKVLLFLTCSCLGVVAAPPPLPPLPPSLSPFLAQGPAQQGRFRCDDEDASPGHHSPGPQGEPRPRFRTTQRARDDRN